MEQAYGNITIVVPELPDRDTEELCNDKALMADLIQTVVSTHSSTGLALTSPFSI